MFKAAPGGQALRALAFRASLFLVGALIVARRPPNLKTRIMPSKRKGWAETQRGTRTQRGYGWEWEQLRLRILKREPLCRACRAAGRAVVATTVDHIKPKHQGGTDDEGNLQPLCKPCHVAKTAKEGRNARR